MGKFVNFGCLDSSFSSNQQEQALILDMIPGVLYWKDKEGNYLKTNEFNLASGINPHEIVGKNDLDIWSEKAEQLKENDQSVITTRRTLVLEETTVEQGLTRHYLAQKAPYFDHDNNVIGIVGLSIDITERKNLELELQKNKEGLFTFDQDIEVVADSDFLRPDLHKKSQYLTNGSAISLTVEAQKFYHDVVDALSVKQLDVLYLTLSGYKMKMIAYHMNIGIETVKTYIKQIRFRLNYHCTTTMIEDCFKHRVKYQFERSQALMNKFHR
ncbi:helix-turn-helix transcriptional regulator [Cysteiniphilum sp. 6C5]|uniref:helix-turn-helix transcriptional regulator n=1 Tax=unclassified Cysteiniphilum TaxID=2610889 RepID=UPI003F83363D